MRAEQTTYKKTMVTKALKTSKCKGSGESDGQWMRLASDGGVKSSQEESLGSSGEDGQQDGLLAATTAANTQRLIGRWQKLHSRHRSMTSSRAGWWNSVDHGGANCLWSGSRAEAGSTEIPQDWPLWQGNGQDLDKHPHCWENSLLSVETCLPPTRRAWREPTLPEQGWPAYPIHTRTSKAFSTMSLAAINKTAKSKEVFFWNNQQGRW